MIKYIDTHCHLNAEEFQADIHDVIRRAQESGVERFYMPSVDASAIASMLELEEQYPGICLPMMGLHPCYVKKNYQEELSIIDEWLAKRRFAAVGEIGLDFYWDTTFAKEQYESFEHQIRRAIDYSLPIVIHSRNAMEETIAVVEKYTSKGLYGIFHCFSGDAVQAKKVVDLGFLLGIGGVITYKKSGLAEAIADIPLEKLVLETDAPYLSPVPFRGKRNESAYLDHIAQKVAEVKHVTREEVASVTSLNAMAVFSK